MKNSSHLTSVIKKPLITEKVSEVSEKFNRYGFMVDLKANKNLIKKTVEELFDVRVEKIWTSILPGKMKRRGRHVFKTGKRKKAIVEVSEGQKIEFFKGV